MDKILKVYKIPEQDSIANVISVSIDTPSVFSEGDRCIKRSGLYATLYVAKTNQSTGVLDWEEEPFIDGMHYFDTSSEEPDFYVYTNGTLLSYKDINFPSDSVQATLFSFDYSASRMGNAPVVSATVKYRTCLDNLWDDRCCVYFNKTFHFINKIPQSEYSNQEDLYKHTAEFVSERVLLENVYFANIVDASHVEDDNVSQYFTFNFFGNISQFVARLNESLKYSGLHYNNGWGFKIVVDNDEYTAAFIAGIEEPDKLVSISEMKIKDALDEIYNLWEVPYYYDGYIIHIGFSNNPLITSAGDSLPVFEYGITDELLSLQKSQTNDIVTRITGFGSSENLPYFYPNDNPNSIIPHYVRGNDEMIDGVIISNPYKTTSLEPSTTTDPNPNGTYFEYGRISVVYKFDQIVWAYGDNEVPPLNKYVQYSSASYENEMKYLYSSRYYTNPSTNTIEDVHACKTVSFYLQHDFGDINTPQSTPRILDDTTELIIKDTYSSNIYFSKSGQVQVFIIPHMDQQSNSFPGWYYWNNGYLQSQYKILDLSYTRSSRDWIWSDGTTTSDTLIDGVFTSGYDNKFPLVFDNLGSNAGVCVFKHEIDIDNDYFNRDNWNGLIVNGRVVDLNSEYENFQIYDCSYYYGVMLLYDTRTVVTQTYLSTNGWSIGGDGLQVRLRDYGIRVDSDITPAVNDIIYFTGTNHITEMQSLLPYNYRNGDGLWLDSENNQYEKQSSTQQSPSYYSFETEYKVSAAKERISKHDEIKPTIEGCYNNETPHKRIDRILDYAFDQNDNSELDNEGKAKHPYFFVKLAKTSADDGYGFNLFDCAINDGVMQIHMKSGPVGGCTFDIMVEYLSNGDSRNPIGLFTEATTINGITYAAGTPKRDTTTGAVLLDCNEDSQQDTSENSVWIALKKDNSTFAGEMLPNLTIHPNINDEFKILNINLPIMYVVEAEKRLMYALLDEMERDNPKKYNFNLKLSSINYKLNHDLYDKWLNEASKISFRYNNQELSYYVSSYTYKMQNTASLPEVTLELSEKLRKIRPLNVRTIDRDFGIMNERIGELDGIIRNMQNVATDDSIGRPSDATINNLRVVGDITLDDGTSVRSRLDSINRRFDSMATGTARETAWNEVATRSEIENMFVDGTFMFDYNKFETSSGASVIFSSGGFFGGNKITCDLPVNGEVSISQNINVIEGYGYTVSMNMSSADGDSSDITVLISYYNSQGKFEDSEKYSIYVEDGNWGQHAFYIIPPEDSSYFTISILNETPSTHPSVNIDGIMVFADDYTTVDENGKTIPSGMLPTRYKISQKELQYAVQTSSSNPYITTSVSEIVLDNEGTTAYVAVRSNTFWEVFDK